MLAAAAIDTIWLYNVTRRTFNDTLKKFPRKSSLRVPNLHKFSCQRNVPECTADKPLTLKCETSCQDVNAHINQKCGALAPSPGNGLSLLRDCHAKHSSTVGHCPNLCTSFQHEPLAAGGTVRIKFFFSIAAACLMFF